MYLVYFVMVMYDSDVLELQIRMSVYMIMDYSFSALLKQKGERPEKFRPEWGFEP